MFTSKQIDRTALIGLYVDAIEAAQDFPWELDLDIPCGGCGAENKDRVEHWEMDHEDDCPWIEAQNRVASAGL